MKQADLTQVESFKDQLQEIIKPYQQEQNRRQKKSDFLKKCVSSIEKNEFFELEELLKSKLAQEITEDSNFEACESIFGQLQQFAESQVDSYLVKFKSILLQLAEEVALPLEIDYPRFSILKGIEGNIDFANRKTTINQITLKTLDPKKIISAALNLKRKLYDSPFEPQKFIDSLFQCYKEILRREGHKKDESVSIYLLYNEYVWSLQNKTFFQNMDKGKFKGYSIEQFAVDLWRFFESNVSRAEGGYQIKLTSGRGKALWLIDHDGQKRNITQVTFSKN